MSRDEIQAFPLTSWEDYVSYALGHLKKKAASTLGVVMNTI